MLLPAPQGNPLKDLEHIRRAVHRMILRMPASEFIDRYCILEDRDAPGVITPFRLWPAQRELVDALDANRLNVVLKARQLGISWLCLAYILREMLRQPGYSVIALSRTETEAKELVRRLGVMAANMPVLLRKRGAWNGPVYSAVNGCVTVEQEGGISTFRALASGKNMGRGFTASLVFLDEWAFQQFDREIWLSVFPSVNRPGGGKVIGVSTMERGSLFEEIFGDENNGFTKHFLSWRSDPRRDDAWYAATRRALGDMVLQEYPETPADAFRIPGGAFFPELCSLHDVKREAEEGQRIYVAMDYGLDRLACLWIAVYDDGTEHVYRELCVSGLIASEAAAEILAASCGEEIYEYLAPPDLWNTDRHSGKSTADVFAGAGIYLRKTSNARIHGWMDVKEHLALRERTDPATGAVRREPTLTMDRETCPELWHCLSRIQKDRRHPNDAASEPHDLTHAPDALRAFCAGRPVPPQAMRKPRLKEQVAFRRKT